MGWVTTATCDSALTVTLTQGDGQEQLGGEPRPRSLVCTHAVSRVTTEAPDEHTLVCKITRQAPSPGPQCPAATKAVPLEAGTGARIHSPLTRAV